MRKAAFAFVAVLVIGFFSVVNSEDHTGMSDLKVGAGGKGKVDFPHAKHQETLKDCSICHTLFPQKIGAIEELVKQEKLKKKQVMNQCRGCHKDMKKAGKPTGPTSCSKCHPR